MDFFFDLFYLNNFNTKKRVKNELFEEYENFINIK